MSDATWARIAQIGGVAGALGTVTSEIGKAVGSSFLTDFGGVAGSIAKSGIAIGTAGAFATAPTKTVANALVQSAPVVTALQAGQQTPAQLPGASGMLGPSNAKPTGGFGQFIVDVFTLPVKLLQAIFGGGQQQK